MPRIIEYPLVAKTLADEGYRCNYPSSGSFSLATGDPIIRGWRIADDETILPELLSKTRMVEPPTIEHLAHLATRAWTEFLPGNLWLTPSSHWSFELNFGHPEPLNFLLNALGLDANMLKTQTNGAAIEFEMSESAAVTATIFKLLDFLASSDFLLIFPGRKASCTIHHHKQLWWVVENEPAARRLDELQRA